MQGREPVCLGCVHYQGLDETLGRVRCSSFPQGIPKDIIRGEDAHIEPRDGEETYKPKDVEAVARFVGDWVVPRLNPALVPEWARRVGMTE